MYFYHEIYVNQALCNKLHSFTSFPFFDKVAYSWVNLCDHFLCHSLEKYIKTELKQVHNVIAKCYLNTIKISVYMG